MDGKDRSGTQKPKELRQALQVGLDTLVELLSKSRGPDVLDPRDLDSSFSMVRLWQDPDFSFSQVSPLWGLAESAPGLSTAQMLGSMVLVRASVWPHS